MRVIPLAVMMAGCAAEPAMPAKPLCAELGAPDKLFCKADGTCGWDDEWCQQAGRFAVEWSHVGTSDSIGVPDPVACTDTISHPCPFLLYTKTLVIVASTGTWTDATGGADEAGVAAENRLPWEDVLTFDERGLVLPQRGDDGGLRHEAVLAKTPTGYEGSVSWHLFTVAGTTTFDVALTRVE